MGGPISHDRRVPEAGAPSACVHDDTATPERMDLHRLGEERSIAMHRAIGELMRVDGAILERARARVRGWLAAGDVHPMYARAWASLLDEPLERIIEALGDSSERGRELRQVTPFAGSLDARTRWAIRRVTDGSR